MINKKSNNNEIDPLAASVKIKSKQHEEELKKEEEIQKQKEVEKMEEEKKQYEGFDE